MWRFDLGPSLTVKRIGSDPREGSDLLIEPQLDPKPAFGLRWRFEAVDPEFLVFVVKPPLLRFG